MALIDEPERNPNRMDARDYDALVANVRTQGFLQPVLVRQVGSRFEIIDGVHRVRAVRAVNGSQANVWSVVTTADQAQATLLQISLNRLRGALDLTEVAQLLESLSGMDVDLAVSGYSENELSDLLRIVSAEEPDPVLDGLSGSPTTEPSSVAKPHILELAFSTAAEKKRATKALRKAAGKGGDLSSGLLRLVDGT